MPFAAIVVVGTTRVQASFFRTLAAALAHADKTPSVVAIEEIGGGVVWRRDA